MRTPGLYRGPNFQTHSQYVSLHFPSLVNPFLAHIGSAHEETGLGNYLRALSAILLLPRLVDSLMEMILPKGVSSCLLKSEIGKVWPNLLMSLSRKTSIGWIIRQLPAHTFLGPKRENANFANKVQYPVSHSVCFPVVSKNFPDRTRITQSFLQRNIDEMGFFVCLFSL